MLLRADELPVHQITETFAAVEGSDPQWNDGHYVCFCDVDGNVSLTSNVRLYQNNDVLDGFICLRHKGRQHNIRLSRRLRPDMDFLGVGPLRIELVEPMQVLRLVLEDGDHGFSLDVLCHSTVVPYEDPVQITRVDGRLLSERLTYELTGQCEGWVSVDGERYELTRSTSSFFRNHSWGYQAGRGGPRIYGAPRAVPRRPAGVRQWVLFDMGDHGGYYHLFDAPDGERTMGRGAILLPDRTVTITDVRHELRFYEGGHRLQSGWFTLLDEEGGERTYELDDLGWVYCQGGGYFGGFDDGLGQGVYRGDYHVEGEVWDVSHPTDVVGPDGVTFELDHAWAENFTRLRSDGRAGLAHFECVVFD
jgi:hypothetical protein